MLRELTERHRGSGVPRRLDQAQRRRRRHHAARGAHPARRGPRRQRATGAVIGSHTIKGRVVMDQLDIIEAEGYRADRFISIHTQEEPDFALHLAVAERGAWIEYDHVGRGDDDGTSPTDPCASSTPGSADQLLLSHDRGWFDPAQPGGGTPKPYTHLCEVFLPKLRDSGVDEADHHDAYPRQSVQRLRPLGAFYRFGFVRPAKERWNRLSFRRLKRSMGRERQLDARAEAAKFRNGRSMTASTDLEHMKIAVLGTGANGAGIGADIARAGLDVTFIDQWPANVEAIRTHGIRVEVGGERVVTPVRALHLCDVATLVEPFDAVLVLVKAYDTRWACELIKPHVAPTGFVVGVQNGMTGETVVDVMGEDRGLDAVIEITAAMYEPGLVERHSTFERSWFAVGAPRPAARIHVPAAAALLRHAGTVEEVDDIRSAKWMKLVLNAGELVPSAILDVSIVDCARINTMRPIMIRAGDEAIRLAKEEGLTIRPIFGMEELAAANPDTFMETILDELVAHYVKPHSRSTFLQDWIKGRHCEVDQINGSVVRVWRDTGWGRRSIGRSSSSPSTSNRAEAARPAQYRPAA